MRAPEVSTTDAVVHIDALGCSSPSHIGHAADDASVGEYHSLITYQPEAVREVEGIPEVSEEVESSRTRALMEVYSERSPNPPSRSFISRSHPSLATPAGKLSALRKPRPRPDAVFRRNVFSTVHELAIDS